MNKDIKIAVFAGGCFWCTEAVFLSLRGVISAEPGYSGGTKENPTYEEVSSGKTGHAESIKITFNSKIILYEDLLTVFFFTHDPTTLNRQGNDVGSQYRSIIFYTDTEQKKVAEEYIKKLTEEKAYDRKIVTEIQPFKEFYLAEDYHKNYYEHHKDDRYCELIITPKIEKLEKKFASLLKNFTEAPFTGKYVDNHKKGLYKCAVCGNELFPSSTKFNSKTGWPSFTDPVNLKQIYLKEDKSHGMIRTEVSCKNCGSHLGHVFDDGPLDKGGKRYCINSACLDFEEEK
ncbi:MAG: peptide-methionine (S)-S-oxide reductase MsrA [Candidatus Taylorbacteria bacterium]|nr:peptide-methionine (S)-S-oxide reductase MsrA [Candidatus Taylorbacteria bacterium]